MCFTIASPSPVPREVAGAVGAVEALEEAAELLGRDAGSGVGGAQERAVLLLLDREGERGAWAGVAEGVLGQVLRHDPEHPGSKRQLCRLVPLGAQGDAGPAGRLLQPGEHLPQDRQRARVPERDDLAAGLELAQEEHLVDQLADLLDLLARLLDERGLVGIGKQGRLEQRERDARAASAARARRRR